MVGKFGKKHLINIPVAGLVCGDSRFAFLLVPVEHLVKSGVIALADIAAKAYGIDLVRIVYGHAPLVHHIGKLFLAVTRADGKGVHFFLLSVFQFAV